VAQVLANIWNALTTLVVFMVIHELLYLHKQARDEQTSRDWIDPVSGAGNARFLFQAVGQEMGRAKRFGRPFSIVYLDIDGLRAVNEKTGRLGGDALLGLLARTVSNNIRQSDLVARVGGDEFALLLPETDGAGTHPVTDRLTRVLTEIFEHDGWPASLTMGVATFITPPDTPDAAVKEAEAAMYAAKESKEEKISYAVYPGTAVAN
jgi:diguanylate cyclase (GGDEF)-like protein